MIVHALQPLVHEIATLTRARGHEVRIDAAQVLDRSDSIALARPGRVSPNGACRLLCAADGWIALNLARPEDVELVHAWLGADIDGADWAAIAAHVAHRQMRDLLAQARVLSLPAASVGECDVAAAAPTITRIRPGGDAPSSLRVLDLSSLWAGPLCASIFAIAGADVLRLESAARPERRDAPHYRRLNGAKRVELIDWSDGARLIEEMRVADVIVTSARPRAFQQRGIDPFDAPFLRGHVVWVAISGYGWSGDQADRVAFGDDAAAAAGLLMWEEGAPRFLGDALADPITGLAAAASALRALSQGGGVLVDAALARCAAALHESTRSAA
ncbi:MAG: CoA transferase [Hyphomonadaceae bacterium]